MTEKTFEQDKLDEYFAYLDELVKSGEKGINIKLLQKMQEVFGYIPEDILYQTADLTGIPSSKLYGAATFYHQFTFTPKGKHVIQLCLGTACYVKGAGEILEEIEKRLDLVDGTTRDGMITIDTTRCIGECQYAPIIVVDDRKYKNVKLEEVEAILASIMEG